MCLSSWVFCAQRNTSLRTYRCILHPRMIGCGKPGWPAILRIHLGDTPRSRDTSLMSTQMGSVCFLLELLFMMECLSVLGVNDVTFSWQNHRSFRSIQLRIVFRLTLTRAPMRTIGNSPARIMDWAVLRRFSGQGKGIRRLPDRVKMGRLKEEQQEKSQEKIKNVEKPLKNGAVSYPLFGIRGPTGPLFISSHYDASSWTRK